jgi:hypothetical protein
MLSSLVSEGGLLLFRIGIGCAPRPACVCSCMKDGVEAMVAAAGILPVCVDILGGGDGWCGVLMSTGRREGLIQGLSTYMCSGSQGHTANFEKQDMGKTTMIDTRRCRYCVQESRNLAERAGPIT